jgi:hypothetical protein
MFCIKCGAQLPDGARFCANCGAVVSKVGTTATKPAEPTPMFAKEPEVVETPKVEETPTVLQTPVFDETSKAEETPKVEDAPKEIYEQPLETAVTEDTPETSEPAPEAPKKKKKGKAIAIIAIIAAALLVLGALIGGVCYFVSTLNGLNETEAVYAYVDSDGTAYLCYADGKCIEIGPGVYDAVLTPDGKKVVVVEENGTVYCTDVNLSEKTEILENNYSKNDDAWVDIAVTNRFVLIEVEEQDNTRETITMYRYEFRSENLLEMYESTTNINVGDAEDEPEYDISYGSIYVDDMAFVKAENGKIKVLAPDSDEFEEIAKYNNNVSFCGISTDGRTVSWVEYTDNKYELKIYVDGEVETAISKNSNEASYVYFDMTCSPKNDVFVIDGENTVVLVKDGEIETVSVSGDVNYYSIYTTNGVLLEKDTKANKADGIYISVETSDGKSMELYLVTFDGDKDRLVRDARYWSVVDETLVYIDTNDTLYCADIDVKAGELGDKDKISSEVKNFTLCEGNADYIYYLKNYSDEAVTADIYVYDTKQGDSEKIKSSVYAYGWRVSEDGRSVYYFTDVAVEAESLVRYGTLYVYNAKDGESEKIYKDVIVYSVTSNKVSGEIDPKSIWFRKYTGIAGDGYKFDIVYYNGKETETVVEEFKW